MYIQSQIKIGKEKVIGMSTPTKYVVIFDFDHSLVDDNSDTLVLEKINAGVGKMVNALYKSVQWTELMDRLLGELHALGHTPEDVRRVCCDLPLRPGMQRTFGLLARKHRDGVLQCFVASDANMFYINTFLEHHGYLGSVVDEVYSNPVTITPEGRLRVTKFVESHTCPTCTRTINMCKGDILRDHIQRRPDYPSNARHVFVCDGFNDLCLLLKLGPLDYALVRKGFSLEKVLQPMLEGHEVRCTVVWWKDYDDLDDWFQKSIV